MALQVREDHWLCEIDWHRSEHDNISEEVRYINARTIKDKLSLERI